MSNRPIPIPEGENSIRSDMNDINEGRFREGRNPEFTAKGKIDRVGEKAETVC